MNSNQQPAREGNPTVDMEIAIVDSSEVFKRSIKEALVEKQYHVTCLSAAGLENHLSQKDCRIVILDLDSVPTDTLFFRHLKRSHPGLKIIVVSRQTYHPDLEEAMSRHIFASINKPVDPDEIVFLLKNIDDDTALP